MLSCGGKNTGSYLVERLAQNTLEPDQTVVYSDSDGLVYLEVPIEEDDSSILLTVVSDKNIALEQVISADGDVVIDSLDWYTADRSLTDAFFADSVPGV